MYCFPEAMEGAYADGLTLEIIPFVESIDPWIATFPNRGLAPGSESAVFSMPSPEHALVIAYGEAYLINASDLHQCLLLDIIPVVGAMAIPEREMVVLYDFTCLEAIGTEGSRWTSLVSLQTASGMLATVRDSSSGKAGMPHKISGYRLRSVPKMERRS